MVSKDPAERAVIARIASNVRWSRERDRKAATEKARAAALERFLREVDPDGVLEPAERLKRAEHAKRAHMLRMARASVQSRRTKKTEDER